MRGELGVEQLVVVAKLQQLGVGVLEQLHRALRAGLGVVDECRVPGRHHEIVGEIGNAVAQHFVAFLGAERRLLGAQQLRDRLTMPRDQFVGAGSRCGVGHGEDQVILGQERGSRPCHRWCHAIHKRPAEPLRGRCGRRGVVQRAPLDEQGRPGIRQRSGECDRHDAVVERLNPAAEVVVGGRAECRAVDDHRRLLILDIRGRDLRQLGGSTRFDQCPNVIEVDRIADVIEKEGGCRARHRIRHPGILTRGPSYRRTLIDCATAGNHCHC